MYNDVLTDEFEQLKSVSISRGLKIPSPDEVGSDVNIGEYNLALGTLFKKFDSFYKSIVHTRSMRFMSEFSTKWSPFKFQNAQKCEPFFVNKIENYGYDSNKEVCRCPGDHLPCTLTQSLEELNSWPQAILNKIEDEQLQVEPEKLTISIGNLERIDIHGNLLNGKENELNDDSKDLICKSSDIILCSTTDPETQVTDWSEWSGCSTRCGPGIEQRMRINYKGGEYSITKESRPCELAKCDEDEDKWPKKCSLRTIGGDGQSSMTHKCVCPDGKHETCKSQDAQKSMDQWIHEFRRFCEYELRKNEEINILQEDLMGNKREILGRTIKIVFPDKYYFDCTENWGVIKDDNAHIPCTTGSPILCTTRQLSQPIKFSALQIKSISINTKIGEFVMWLYLGLVLIKWILKIFMQRAVVAPIKSIQVDDIDIEFKDSIYNATYYLYNQQIHSIWLRGKIIDVNTEHQFFDIDDSLGRVLRIQYCQHFVDLQAKDLDILKIDNIVSIICSITHLILGNEAFLNFKLYRISKVLKTDIDYWPTKMSFESLNQSTSYDDAVMKSFQVSVAFKDRFSATNGMDWDKTGEFMINSSYDKTVYIYSVSKASVTNALQSKKHGVELVKFTNDSPRHILCSSESDSPNVAVRLWDVVENRYIKSFSLDTPLMRGVGILSHPNRNLMITNGVDGAVSVYSLDNTTPIMSFQAQAEAVGAFDFDGLIMARYLGSSSKLLSLYDLNKLQSPFKTFDLSHVLKKTEDVNSILFNPNGRFIILGTNFSRLICVNSVNGAAIFACCYGQIPASKTETSELCYPAISPDGKYLISGCLDNSIKVWNFKGQLITTLKGHEGSPAFVAFNPRKAIISSACVNVAWWHPTQTS